MSKTNFDFFFKKFWNKANCEIKFGKNPTIHSLRHTYVVMRLNKWMEEGLNIQKMMPYLSKQLGHSSINGTQYYYHTAEASASLLRKIDNSSDKIISKLDQKSSIPEQLDNKKHYDHINSRSLDTKKQPSLIPKVKLYE